MFSFWSQSQPQPQQLFETQTQIKPNPIYNQINQLNIVDELKKFQQNGELKKTVFTPKEEKKLNPIWAEILETRYKVLFKEKTADNIVSSDIGITSDATLEDRVKCLEKEVKDLKNIVRQFLDITDLHIVIPDDWA